MSTWRYSCTRGQGHSLTFVQGHLDFINIKQLLLWSHWTDWSQITYWAFMWQGEPNKLNQLRSHVQNGHHDHTGVLVYLVPGDKIPRGILSPGTLYPGLECPPPRLILSSGTRYHRHGILSPGTLYPGDKILCLLYLVPGVKYALNQIHLSFNL